jgi:hypothetical protein
VTATSDGFTPDRQAPWTIGHMRLPMAREPINVDARATVRRAGGAFWLALAACSTSPPSEAPIPRALERFADACQFVPPDMLSFAFYEVPADPNETPSAPRSQPQRIVCAGRDFTAPPLLGCGRYRGIEIRDFGPGPGNGLQPESKPPTAEVGGVPAWFTPEKAEGLYEPPSWQVQVDGRYVLISSDREVLAAALLRDGRLARILQPFDAVRLLADDANAIVCALPRPGIPGYFNLPVPIETMVSAVLPGPRRLQMLHRQPLTDQYAGLFTLCDHTQQTTIGTWLVSEGTLQDEQYDGFLLYILFGLVIFI